MDEQSLQLSAVGPERLPTLRDIETPPFRHRKLVLLTFVSLVLATVLGIVLLPNSYKAEMEILVKHERVDAAVSPGRDAAATGCACTSTLLALCIWKRPQPFTALLVPSSFSRRKLGSTTRSFAPRKRSSGTVGHALVINVKHTLKTRDLDENARVDPGDMLYMAKNVISRIKPFIPLPSVGMYANQF